MRFEREVSFAEWEGREGGRSNLPRASRNGAANIRNRLDARSNAEKEANEIHRDSMNGVRICIVWRNERINSRRLKTAARHLLCICACRSSFFFFVLYCFVPFSFFAHRFHSIQSFATICLYRVFLCENTTAGVYRGYIFPRAETRDGDSLGY